MVAALTAILLGNRQAEEAQFAHLADAIIRDEAVVAFPVQQVRRDLGVAEIAHRFVERELLFGDQVGQVGVDSAGHSACSVTRQPQERDDRAADVAFYQALSG